MTDSKMSSFMLIHQVVSKIVMTSDWTMKYKSRWPPKYRPVCLTLSIDQAFCESWNLLIAYALVACFGYVVIEAQ